jgi:hypothetical protein
VAANFVNNAVPVDTDVNGQTIDTVNNNFFGEQAIFTYTSDPAATWEQETEQGAFSFKSTSGSGSYVAFNALQPKALAQLKAMTLPAGGITLNVSFQVKGKWESGSSGETNTFTFPITVVNSGFAGCAAGETLVGTQVCGNFQDGPVTCEAAPAGP